MKKYYLTAIFVFIIISFLSFEVIAAGSGGDVPIGHALIGVHALMGGSLESVL